MNIGFVSTWFERGAAYVTKQYQQSLSSVHKTFVYARGGEIYAKNDPKYDKKNVTWGLRLLETKIHWPHFKKWLKRNRIDVVFFNEQHDLVPVLLLKKEFPSIKIGSYIDYYKKNTVSDFNFYDFLVCNTKRHYSVFKDHPQCYYIPWGTNTDLFMPQKRNQNSQITFFHSVGMSNRKGTDLLIEAFIKGKLFKESKLVIHTQVDIRKTLGISIDNFQKYNIELIHKTVPAPGLYHKGDVYVYPTYLEGLGLTIYEALSCGLPVITTNNPPMNEIINDEVGKLVDVEKFVSRSDGYYWPLSYCSKDSLIKSMEFFINNKNRMKEFQQKARNYTLKELEWRDRKEQVINAFENSKILNYSKNQIIIKLKKLKRKKHLQLAKSVLDFLPHGIQHMFYSVYMKKSIRNKEVK